MTFNTLVKSAVAAAIAATSSLPLSTAANAHDWHGPRGFERDHNHFERYDQRYDNDYRPREAYRPRESYGYRRHRDNIGPAIAIGAFATILGLAIASEAGNSGHRTRHFDRN